MGRQTASGALTEAESRLRIGGRDDFDLKPLDAGGFVPMYFQIQSQLLDQIQRGRFQPGDMLPGEQDLCRLFGVSRMTARQALQALKQRGFAHSQKGRGTFVSPRKVEKQVAHLCGFSAEMASLGMKPGSQVLGKSTKAATSGLAASLTVSIGSPLFELRRLRLANGSPLAIEDVWLPLSDYPGIDGIDFSRHSLYRTLREQYGVHFGSAEEAIEARAPSRTEAKLLKIAPSQCLLVISRTIKTAAGKPVEVSRSLYRSDRYRAVLIVPAALAE